MNQNQINKQKQPQHVIDQRLNRFTEEKKEKKKKKEMSLLRNPLLASQHTLRACTINLEFIFQAGINKYISRSIIERK